MFIKELIIDGFKSYANRTVVSGWDSEFNAITGFNGTGKSNLLDSICFVLGISNLSQVRANSLQDLVYKQGQSRVTRASVTIVFDNSDKSRSPISYESFPEITVTRQVVVGGRNKYLVNGKTYQQSQVQNLFHSVGLNVNNPHFLIMQGRITKVCNMRPLETLGLVEEAAGTKMFEVKKQAAQKTILKKQAKVDEINRIMSEEINPVLDRLRHEKQNFYKFTENKTKIEALQKLATALGFYQAQQKLAAMESEIAATKQRHQDLCEEVEAAQASLAAKQKALEALHAKRDEEFANNPAFQALESKGNTLSKSLVSATTHWQNLQESLEDERKELRKMEKKREEAAKNLENKKAQHAAAEAQANQASADHARIVQDVANIRSAQLGIVVEGGEGEGSKKDQQGGFAGQLMGAQRSLAEEEGSAKSLNTKLKHATASLKDQEAKLKAGEKEGSGLAKDIANKQSLISKLQAALKDAKFDPALKASKESRISALQDAVAALSYEADSLEAKLGSRLKFDYNAKAAGVDPKSVKGQVATLLRVPDVAHATALEVVAGGKLYNVIVDTEVTGKAVLDKGQLKKRVTVIPLNKIAAKPMAASAIAKAEQMAAAAGGKAQLALSVVGYDADLGAAMQWIFGSSFLVSDSALASKITFHPEVRSKCVTLEGDVYDPAGTMEGGSMQQGPSVLAQLQKLNTLSAERDAKRAEIAALTREINEMAAAESKMLSAQKAMDVASIELKALQGRQSHSEHFVLAEAVAALKSEIASLTDALKASESRRKEHAQRITELESLIRDFEGAAAEKGKVLEKRLASLAKDQAAASKKQAEASKKSSMLFIELGELVGELEAIEAALAKLSRETIKALERDVAASEKDVTTRRAEFDAFSVALAAEKEKASALDKSLAKLGKEIASLTKAASDASLESKKLNNTLLRLVADKLEEAKALSRLEKESPWIKDAKARFGVLGGEYDFESAGVQSQLSSLAALEAEQELLSRRINKKVMTLFEKAELDALDLDKKRAIILEDKAQIELVIRELDVEKTKTLQHTWETVSASFGTIFATLLPGVSAELVLAEGATSVMDGLDIRVSFGGVVKESLSELSGGQRSLLALSLILALLKFKPAPMYILDEIDSALDLSHTQNIGQVLKKHFSESQFIVVSLKEGMFNNANVLFRTKFVEGVSTVIRTTVSDRRVKA